LEEGLAFAERVIAREPADPRAGFDIGGYSPYIQTFTFKAMSLQNLGRYVEAVPCIEKAVSLAQAHGDQEVLGWARNSYAFIEWGTGNDMGALGHSRQGLEIAEKSGSGISRVMARWGRGMAQMVRKDWEGARQIHEEALVISRESRAAVFAQPSILSMLSLTYLELGDVERAGEAAEESIRMLDGGSDRLNEPLAHLARARVLLRAEGTGARERIEAALDRAAAISRDTGSRIYLPRVHEARAELALLLGDDDGHARELRTALGLYEEINADGHAARIRKELAA
jgi:tetratricopeptide (TPR) repeat protein